ncbi:RelA/SpoT family protein [Hydrogenimonas cancrithermarum]|uniref:Bifunctional (P)ppGpp synthase/hydrolase n=1 Tax=Hydrogenimonas cancrithermarum TaxID=2993563 RepID=A0ABM8FNF6_9BACT|nr:RelA/SpoT family protein [Hydrogenimonas cancrithermarum]BDY13898.1 bifunctional (p)ppGpp synthase/hydrolase [Hydrogenimonas cancrithermarum]
MHPALEPLLDIIRAVKTVDEAETILFDTIEPTDAIRRALDFAGEAHKEQLRKSGEPYIIHPILVAAITASISEDETMVLAALLHDVVEDTPYTIDDIEERFGEDVAYLVEGLTKIVEIRDSELVPSTSDEKLISSALSFRKMLICSIEDVRVLVIKLCDRLHNMMTLDALPEPKQHRIAEETLVVYAPIAHRLGIAALKNKLEDLSFYYLFPKEYAKIDAYIRSHRQDFQIKLNTFISKVKTLMVHNGFHADSFEIFGRVKHYYSIYLKMQRKGISIDEILDLLAIRILVPEPIDCYRSLGTLHLNFKPLIARFKDYVALPKENGYQTLHTTVFDDTSIIEAQIRTFEMHKTAEFGIAAHWKYKLGESLINIEWLKNLQYQNESIEEFYELVKNDLYSEDISVFTPAGDQITLPRGATVLDFAYAVHTQVGERASAALVNKQPSSLLSELKNGDLVRIITADHPIYHCTWIDAVKTSRAKSHMRTRCNQRRKEIDRMSAVNILSATLGLPAEKTEAWIEEQGLAEQIYRVARELSFYKEVIHRFLDTKKEKSILSSIFQRPYRRLKRFDFENFVIYSTESVNSVEFDYCCHPKRGDPIVAFKLGNKAVVHHKFCEKAYTLIQKRTPMLFVEWSENRMQRYRLLVTLKDEKGALAKLLAYLAKIDSNIISIKLGDGTSQSNLCEVIFESKEHDQNHLKKIIERHFKVIELVSLTDAYKQ